MSDTKPSYEVKEEVVELELAGRKEQEPVPSKGRLIRNLLLSLTISVMFLYYCYEGMFWLIRHMPEDMGGMMYHKCHHRNEGNQITPSSTTKATISKRDSSSSSSSSSKSTPPQDQPGIRFLFVLAAIIVLNMVAICVHHVFLKMSRTNKPYRSIDQHISPF